MRFKKTSSLLMLQKQDLEYVQETIKNCKYISIECDDSMKKSQQVVTLASLSLILANNVTAMQYRSELPETSMSLSSLIFYIIFYSRQRSSTAITLMDRIF